MSKTLSKVYVSSGLVASLSTVRVSPSATLYCLPPVVITAYFIKYCYYSKVFTRFPAQIFLRACSQFLMPNLRRLHLREESFRRRKQKAEELPQLAKYRYSCL